MDNMKHKRLQELDRSDFEIVKGEPDIRGWDVKNTHGEKIGEVEELILDAKEKKVRYMVVDLDDNQLKLDHRKVLIPIGLAELDGKHDDVLLPNISGQQLSALPAYTREELTPDVERKVCSTLGRPTEPTKAKESPGKQPERARTVPQSTAKPGEKKTTGKNENEKEDPDFYRHEYYSLDNLYKNRMHEAKSVKGKHESEYERSLRLWERRSEGGIIADDSTAKKHAQPATEHKYEDRELDEEARMEMIRNRRNNYRQRRYRDETRSEEQERG